MMTGLIDKRKVLCATVHRLMIMHVQCVCVCVCVRVCVCVVEVCVCILNKKQYNVFANTLCDVLYTAPYGVVFLLIVCVCVCVCAARQYDVQIACVMHIKTGLCFHLYIGFVQ